MMFAPFHAVAAAEILDRTLTHVKQVLDDLLGARQIDGTARSIQISRITGPSPAGAAPNR